MASRAEGLIQPWAKAWRKNSTAASARTAPPTTAAPRTPIQRSQSTPSKRALSGFDFLRAETGVGAGGVFAGRASVPCWSASSGGGAGACDAAGSTGFGVGSAGGGLAASGGVAGVGSPVGSGAVSAVGATERCFISVVSATILRLCSRTRCSSCATRLRAPSTSRKASGPTRSASRRPRARRKRKLSSIREAPEGPPSTAAHPANPGGAKRGPSSPGAGRPSGAPCGGPRAGRGREGRRGRLRGPTGTGSAPGSSSAWNGLPQERTATGGSRRARR